MGRIPLFERQRLASSVVGTPGTERTGVIVSQTLGSLAAQSRRAENAKREIADNAEVQLHKARFENQMAAHLDQAEKEFTDDPYKVSENFNQQAAGLLNSMAEGISNERVKSKFINDGILRIEKEQGRVNKRASAQASTNAYINTGSTYDAKVESVGFVQSLEDLAAKEEELLAIRDSSVQTIGPQKADELYKIKRKDFYTNYLYANAEKSPDTMKQYIEQDVFDSVLDEKEQFSVNRTLDSIIKKRDDRNRRETYIDRTAVINDVYEKEITGQLTLKEIDASIRSFREEGADEADVKSLLTIKKALLTDEATKRKAYEAEVLKTNKILVRQRRFNLGFEIDDEMDRLTKNVEGEYETPTEAETLELKKLRDKIQEAYVKGDIPVTKAKKDITQINEAIKASIFQPPETEGGFFGIGAAPVSGYGKGKTHGLNFAKANFPNKEERNRFYGDIMENYTSYFDQASEKDGFSPEKLMNKIIEKVKVRYGR